MVELRGVSKYFPSNGVMALENAALSLRPGEIHALLGENGTGKSTLMHILAGYFPPSSGGIFIDGKERRFSMPSSALAAGIGMVRQHPALIRGFKVWEDCILGAEKPKRRSSNVFQKCRDLFFEPRLARKRLEELSVQWHFDLPLDSRTESLTVSQRQKAAVLALLLRDVKWFIFDEPTAVLTAGESNALFQLLSHLRGEGRGIILITHKLDEALDASDRVTVIRRGVTQEPSDTAGLSLADLKSAIFSTEENQGVSQIKRQNTDQNSMPSKGDSHHSYVSTPHCTLPITHSPSPVLEINNLHLEPSGLPPIQNVNLQLMPGKIIGITGARDSGLETLELAVAGLIGCSGKGDGGFKGSITLNGRDIAGKGIRAFRKAGGAYLGADRLGNNLALNLSMGESLAIHAYRRAGRGIFLNKSYLNSWCDKIMSRAGITRPVSYKASSFSGGMLQRILLAREFAEDASLIVLAEPGSGLDTLNRSILVDELSRIKRGSREQAALLFSADKEELISLADEIFVLKDGELISSPGEL